MLCGKWRNSRYQFLQFGLIWWGYSTHNLLHLRRACWPLLHINGHSWLITVFPTRLIQWVSLMEQELSNLPLHPSSPPVFIGVRVTQSLPLCVCFVDRFFSPFVIFILSIMLSSSSIYGFWLPPWYLKNFLCPIWKSNSGFYDDIQRETRKRI